MFGVSIKYINIIYTFTSTLKITISTKHINFKHSTITTTIQPNRTFKETVSAVSQQLINYKKINQNN